MIKIDREKCISCKLCIKDCISANIELMDEKASIKGDTCLMCGHCIAICPKYAVSMDDYPMEDVKEYNKKEFAIEPDRLLNNIKFRRSIRHFESAQVEKEKLLKIIEVGRFTATGGNRQNVSYLVVQEKLPELRRLALERLCETTAQLAGLNPMYAGLAQRWTKQLESDKEQSGKNDGLFFNAPTLILLTSEDPVDAALAASNMELMAAAQDLGVLYCGFFVRAAQGNDKIKKLFSLSEAQEIRICLVIGKPDVTYVRTVPRKLASIQWC